jgi:hypothetical protein
VSRTWLFLECHGLDPMILLAAAASSLGVALRDDAERRAGLMSWIEMILIAGVMLCLLGRHRFPFVAPAAVWPVCAALSFVDGRLIVKNDPLFVAGMVAALKLGNLRHDVQARIGLVIVLGGAAVVVHNDPGRVDGDLVFTPVLFALGWLVGFARGAVRHRMPESDTNDRETLRLVEQAGRTALSEMRRLLDAMRHDDDALELLPPKGLDDLDALADDVRATGLAVRDDGTGGTPGDGDLGHGLVGVGERVKIHGGQMSAGPSTTGGFVLHVRLPLDGRQP